MDDKLIEIIVNKEELGVPERIVFETIFYFQDKNSYERKIEAAHREWLSFLQEKKLIYCGPKEITFQGSNEEDVEFEYSSPGYVLTLTRQSYRKLKNYQATHPELEGFVLSAVFKEKDEKDFLEKIIAQAREEAAEVAESKGLTLLKEYGMTDVKQTERWVAHLPFGARVNHFKQCLTGEYKFLFKVKPA